jgi:hypothetical protein
MVRFAMASGRTTLTLFAALLSFGCATAGPSPVASESAVDLRAEATAVSRAEEFVRVNGYVAKQDADPARVVRESCCADGGEIEPILARRADTLLGAACAVMPGNAKTEEPGWTVVFCYDPRNKEYREAVPNFPKSVTDRGRAVVMDLEGTNPRIVHQDFSLLAKGSKRLRGMALFEDILRRQAAEPRVAADGAAPRR